jgi:hypothetical protein
MTAGWLLSPRGLQKRLRIEFSVIRASFSAQRNAFQGCCVSIGGNDVLQRLYAPINFWYKRLRSVRQRLLIAVGIKLMGVVTSIEVGVSFFSNSNFYWRLHAIENAVYLRT